MREKYCWLVADKPSEQGVCEEKYCMPHLVCEVKFVGLFSRLTRSIEYRLVTK
jgi:hypothetical protein